MDNRKLNYFYEKKKKRTDSICYGDIDFIWLMGIRQCAPGQRQSIFFFSFFYNEIRRKLDGLVQSVLSWMFDMAKKKRNCRLKYSCTDGIHVQNLYFVCTWHSFFFYLLFSLPHYLPFIFDSFTCLWFFFFPNIYRPTLRASM